MINSSCQLKMDQRNESIEVFEYYSELREFIEVNNDKTLVINFWATSCRPCLEEMPHFNELQRTLNPEEVKILLVSLDPVSDLDTKVYPFVKRLGVAPEVVILNDQNYSGWTDQIDPGWYGALPATLIVKRDKRVFRFGAYETYRELLDDVAR